MKPLDKPWWARHNESMKPYAMSNSEVLWEMLRRFNIKDNIADLQLDRKERLVRSYASDNTWKVPDTWDLS